MHSFQSISFPNAHQIKAWKDDLQCKDDPTVKIHIVYQYMFSTGAVLFSFTCESVAINLIWHHIITTICNCMRHFKLVNIAETF